ncbi:peptidase T [Yersinia enterocolitica]|nr:peptidase T [Yersinia enterocolitica]
MDKLLDRFFNYVSFDTQAKANVKSVPSTEGQRKLALALQHELQMLGVFSGEFE